MFIASLTLAVVAGWIAARAWYSGRVRSRRADAGSIRGEHRRYREIFENGSDGVFVVEVPRDGRFRFESLNPAALRGFGHTRTHLCGQRIDAVARRAGAGLARALFELEAHLRVCVAKGLPCEYDSALYPAADGQTIFHRLKLVPMADDDGISHVLCFVQDTTACKRYEQTLLERLKLQERLAGFAASAPGFLFTLRRGSDGSDSMPFASAGIEHILGLTPSDVTNDLACLSLRIPGDDMSAFMDATILSATLLTPVAIELRVNHPRHGERWVEARAMPALEPDGSIEWHGVMLDVTERKQADARLREAHAFTEGIVNALSDPLFVKDREHRWVLLNDACCALIGQPREVLLGKSDYDFFPKEQADEFWAGDERVFASGQVDVNEEPIVAGDGDVHHLHTKKTPYRIGERSFIIAVVRDITERKAMEEDVRRSREGFAEAQRIGQMGSWELNLDTGALCWSEQTYRLLETAPHAGAPRGSFLSAVHPDDRAAVSRAYLESMDARQPYCVEYRLLPGNGRLKYVRECGETLYAPDGRPLRYRGTIQDITVLKETELRLRDTQDRLRELAASRESQAEQERKRIAWAMHEELGQLLAATKMRICGMRSQFPKDADILSRDARAVIELVDMSVKTVHDIVSKLRPPVLGLGAVASLEWLVAEFTRQHAIACDVEFTQRDYVHREDMVTIVFRMAQETLEFVARHAGVSNVTLHWHEAADECQLTIRFNGEPLGHDAAQEQLLVLFGMQERITAFGGDMRIYSAADHYTAIDARFPSTAPHG